MLLLPAPQEGAAVCLCLNITAVPRLLNLFLYVPSHILQASTARCCPLAAAAAACCGMRQLQPAAPLPERHGSVPTGPASAAGAATAASIACLRKVGMLLQLNDRPPAVSIVSAIPAGMNCMTAAAGGCAGAGGGACAIWAVTRLAGCC